jgi:hypothetical protein
VTRARRFHAVLAATAAMTGMTLGFIACGSSESGPPVSIDDFARLIAEAHCKNIGPCCQERGFAHDLDECLAGVDDELRSEIEKSRANPNLTWDGDAARECLDAYTAVVKECRDDDDLGDVCRYIFAGRLEVGQTCASSSECIRGSTCQRTVDGSASQCSLPAAPTRGALGDGCFATCTERTGGGSNCSVGSGPGTTPGTTSCFTNDGLYCDSTFRCARHPTVGEPCSAAPGIPCAGDAYCDLGTCTARRATGSCATTSAACALTTYCDVAQQCVPRKSTGAACQSSEECLSSDQCVNGACLKRSIASASKCRGNL